MIDTGVQNPEAAPVDDFRSLALKLYVPVPASGMKVALLVVTPVMNPTNEVEVGRLIWTSNTNPVGGLAAAQVTVKVVDVVPEVGLTLVGTFT